MSGPSEPTLRSLLEARVIPNEGLEDKCLDTNLSELTGGDIRVILDHLNTLYIPSPSIRLHILPFTSHLFLAHPSHSSLLTASTFFPTLISSLLLDPSTRILEQGLRLLDIVIPAGVVPFSARLPELLAVMGKALVFSQTRGKRDNFFVPQSGTGEMRRRRSSSVVGGVLSPLRGMKDLPPVGGDDQPQPQPHQPQGGQGSALGLGLALGTTSNENQTGTISASMDTTSITSENEDKITGLSLSPPTFMHHLHNHRSGSGPNKISLQPAPGSGWKVYNDPAGGLEEVGEVYELYHHPHHHTMGRRNHQVQAQGHSRTQSAGTTLVASPRISGSSYPTYSNSVFSEYLSLLYTAFPLNLIGFVADPAGYLREKGMGCPFDVGEGNKGWEGVWKDGELGRLISPYMRSFLFNPALLTGTPRSELEAVQTKFGKTEPDEFVGLAGSLLAVHPAQGMVETSPRQQQEEEEERRPKLPPRSMTELTDLTSGSTSVASMSPTSRTVRHRRSSELALPTTGASNPLMAMSIAGRTGVNTYAPAHPIAIRQAGGLGSLSAGNDGEVDRLRKQVEGLTLELEHQKKLAGMYLQHVNRLYQSAVSARSGEAEQQNLYNHIKDQERATEQKNRELQSIKDELARTRKSSSEEKARLSAKMAENRELKKQVSQKQGARNDEILDRESLITHLKTELIKEKEKSFKLDNRLREAEPKIKKIGDYEKQIDRFEENQLLWDDDIQELKNQKNAVQTMTSAFVQMQHHTKAMQDEHDQLVDQVTSLKVKLDDLSFENGHLRKKTGASLEGEEDAPKRPSFLQSEVDTLRQKVEAAQGRVHDLEQELLEANADQEELEFLRKVRALGKSSMLA